MENFNVLSLSNIATCFRHQLCWFPNKEVTLNVKPRGWTLSLVGETPVSHSGVPVFNPWLWLLFIQNPECSHHVNFGLAQLQLLQALRSKPMNKSPCALPPSFLLCFSNTYIKKKKVYPNEIFPAIALSWKFSRPTHFPVEPSAAGNTSVKAQPLCPRGTQLPVGSGLPHCLQEQIPWKS